MDITIEQLTTFSSEITHALNHLLEQLETSSSTLEDKDVKEMLTASSNRLLVAKQGDTIVGMTTLIIYRIPVWKKGWIEDVVVDKAYRGNGIGTKLLHYAVDQAKKEHVKYLDLTSRPGKEIAHKLYERFGFKKRDTYVFRLAL